MSDPTPLCPDCGKPMKYVGLLILTDGPPTKELYECLEYHSRNTPRSQYYMRDQGDPDARIEIF